MQVLIATQPADGHLNPMLGLSAALRAAGHQVSFATAPRFVARVEARGESARAVGVDWLESEGAVEPTRPDVDPAEQPPYFERLFLRRVAARSAHDLVAVLRADPPDVVVREATEFGAAAAAARCGIPFATFDFSFPFDMASMIASKALPDSAALDRLRAEVGLGATDDPDWFRGQLVISNLPDGYRRPQPLAEPNVVVRPNVLDVVDDADVPSWLGDTHRAVYVTLGTVFTRFFPEVLGVAARGAALTGRHTIVTVGASGSLDDFSDSLGDHVRVASYLPQGPVLERCVAAVVHGGTGTTLGALARGVPLVIVPLGADQFDHADAVVRNGAGVMLDHEGLEAAAVAAAVEQVTADPSFAAAARRLGGDLLRLPGPELAVEALERLAG